TGVVSVYRRPLPTTNVGFLSTIMWDGREPNFESQAVDATLGHAQAAAPPTPDQVAHIVSFQKGVFTAQVFDNKSTSLTADNRNVLAMLSEDLRPVARVEELFNNTKVHIPGLARLHADLNTPSTPGFCGTCHHSPNIGHHSVKAPLDIGVPDAGDKKPPVLDISGLPVFTLTCTQGPLAGKVYKVTDPGRAMISGRCKDIGRFKGPILRGLASRAPYFHNGSAATLRDVVDF